MRRVRAPEAVQRSHRFERMARIFDREIAPLWSEPLGRLLMRELELPRRALVLDAACRTGFTALRLLAEAGEGGRVVGIDSASSMLEQARVKAGAQAGRSIFFRSEESPTRLPFADEVYDLTVKSSAADDPVTSASILELARVTKAGGQVAVTVLLSGTYQELFDLMREALVLLDRPDALERLEAHLGTQPTLAVASRWLEGARLDEVTADEETFTLLFRSARELFFSPFIELGPLPSWKAIAGKGTQMQEVFWQIKRSIDTYFGNRGFPLTVKAACLRGRKLEREDAERAEQEGGLELRTGEFEVIDASIEEMEPSIQELDLESDPDDPVLG